MKGRILGSFLALNLSMGALWSMDKDNQQNRFAQSISNIQTTLRQGNIPEEDLQSLQNLFQIAQENQQFKGVWDQAKSVDGETSLWTVIRIVGSGSVGYIVFKIGNFILEKGSKIARAFCPILFVQQGISLVEAAATPLAFFGSGLYTGEVNQWFKNSENRQKVKDLCQGILNVVTRKSNQNPQEQNQNNESNTTNQ